MEGVSPKKQHKFADSAKTDSRCCNELPAPYLDHHIKDELKFHPVELG
jgi:hypothetical protein